VTGAERLDQHPRGLSLSPELWEAILPEIEELARAALDARGGERNAR